MKKMFAVFAVAAFATTAAAQAGGGMAGMNMEATKKIAPPLSCKNRDSSGS